MKYLKQHWLTVLVCDGKLVHDVYSVACFGGVPGQESSLSLNDLLLKIFTSNWDWSYGNLC